MTTRRPILRETRKTSNKEERLFRVGFAAAPLGTTDPEKSSDCVATLGLSGAILSGFDRAKVPLEISHTLAGPACCGWDSAGTAAVRAVMGLGGRGRSGGARRGCWIR